MTRLKIGGVALGLMIGVLAATPANAWKRGNVDVLAVLPAATGSVEGLTVGPDDGNIYVPTFGFNTQGGLSGPATLFVISPNGKLINQVTITTQPPLNPASAHMLGLGFNPVTKDLLVIDFGANGFTAGDVLKVDPKTGQAKLFMNPIPGSGLNALTFDKSGNVYVSDSFNGVIWKTGPNGGTATQWCSDPLLRPGKGLTPPFGANGVAFSNDGNFLYVANTAFHQIIKIPVHADGTACSPSIFITGINAPDGIVFDRDDNLWVCANQEDEIVIIDPTGKVIAKLGDFRGIDPKGIARGFLFPASLAFSNDRSTLYVSNLTLNLPFATNNGPAAIDSAWTLEVSGYTVSKLRARIPPFPDDNE
jgi:sugar lactone lactonase YvrE